ncbi:DMT family transporter [Proteobacteria bacterium 005FR1]|nr:DMT family transporter [Proteobacteria bacterium 005FR1]
MPARSILLVILVAALWGGNFVAVKVSTGDFPPIFLLTLRFAFVAALVLPFAKRPSRQELLPVLAISAALGGLHFGLMFTGLSRIEASTAAIATQLGVPFSTLLAVVLFRETLGWRRILGVAVAFSGVALLAGAPEVATDIPGLAMIVAAAFAWAVANTIIKRFGPFDPFMLTAWMALFAVPQLLALSLLIESGQWRSLAQAQWPAWAGVAYTVLGSSILAYGIWYSLINTSDVSRLVPFTLLAPVFALFAAATLLGEPLTLPLIAGAALTILGVALCEIRFRRWRRRSRLNLE